jgi:NAD+ synthase
MAEVLNIMREIREAPPTDGLWDDKRTDEEQLGMTYGELEVAMIQDQMGAIVTEPEQLNKLNRYRELREQNKHKMESIPVCNMESFR